MMEKFMDNNVRVTAKTEHVHLHRLQTAFSTVSVWSRLGNSTENHTHNIWIIGSIIKRYVSNLSQHGKENHNTL